LTPDPARGLVRRISQSPNIDSQTLLLDACEHVLARDGRTGLTTRRVAHEAGLNHGLVHYHFGSLETLTAAVAHRYLRRKLAERAVLLDRPGAFIDRWREIVQSLDSDLESGDARVEAELRAIGFDQPDVRAEVAEALEEWRVSLTRAFSTAAGEYGLTASAVEPIVTLVTTFTAGLAGERLVGVTQGHQALYDWFDGMIVSVSGAAAS
jgi:AcrR family transcriptional regulator